MTLADEIRALRVKRLSTYYSGWNAAIDRAAALAEAHESALVAAAYEAAADACADYPRVAPGSTEARHYDEQIEHSQACIGAMTPADASAALDRMLTEAWKRGMREAAGMATSFLVGHPGEGVPMRSPTPHEIKRRILAAAEKESGNG